MEDLIAPTTGYKFDFEPFIRDQLGLYLGEEAKQSKFWN
jgi:hypothetical protein